MHVVRAIAVICLTMLSILLAIPTVAVAEGEPSFSAISDENLFPFQIRFNVQAGGSEPITRLTLRYRLGGSNVAGYTQPAFTPDKMVTAQYVWNLQRRYLPPGAEIEYYWEAQDASGSKAESQRKTVIVSDNRFQWQRMTDGQLSLSWYQGDQRFAMDLLQAGKRALKQLTEEVGVGTGGTIAILVYATQQEMLGALPAGSLQWTGGQAFPESSVVVLVAPPTEAGRDYGLRTIPHELSHLVVHSATDNPYGGVPQWLDEGLATLAEGEPASQLVSTLESAISHDGLLSIRSLNGNFPSDPQESLLAYAQSFSFVAYMLDHYGREKMSALLAVFREGSTPDDAMVEVYGRNLATMDDEWRQVLLGQGARPGSIPGKIVPGGQAGGRPPPAGGGQPCFGGMLAISSVIVGVFWTGRRTYP